MTTVYTVKDILDSSRLKNDPILNEFVAACKENLVENPEPKNKKQRVQVETRNKLLQLKQTDKFCYNIGSKICISRLVLETIIEPDSVKTKMTESQIIGAIAKLTGKAFDPTTKRKYYNFISSAKTLGRKQLLAGGLP